VTEHETSTAAPSAPGDGAGSIVIVGAGPAGLTAAQELAKGGVTSTVLEADDVVGGISRTVQRDGWRFDIGGHRFFTKVKRVDDFWHEILEDDEFMLRPRSSRIYYEGKFYDYPIKLGNALRNLGPVEAVRCGLSFLWVRVRPPKDQTTLEGYVVSNYGWRLYGHFFEAYSTKVWGVPPSEISAEWGAQRIKGMTLWSAVWEPFRARLAGAREDKSKQVTSLIEEFQYPKFGPGMMWERCRDKVEAAGTKVIMETPVTKIRHEGGRATAVVAESEGVTTEYPADHVISSMPFSLLLKAMDRPSRPRSRPRPTTSPSATSCRWRSSCRPTRCRGPTTGSTSTPPRSRPCGCRTSARGRRTWSARGTTSSASSTRSKRATSGGPPPTTS
jgi:protoporphyrinogen oxidase